MNLGIPELLILLLVGGLTILGTIFWVWMIVEAATLEEKGSQDRLIWVIVTVFTHLIGAAIYFFVRRPARKAALGR